MTRLGQLGFAGFVVVAGVLGMATRVGALPTWIADSVVVSPEVGADNKVTVRLSAPGAKAVKVTGDFILAGAAMSKDDKGVWSYTTAALKPSVYGYSFNVDGIRIPDPGNLTMTTGAAHLKSYVDVPGPKGKPEFWEVRDVPHGTLHENLYTSPTLGLRRAIVYTPPGYDAGGGAAAKTYPVMYLFHSSTDNETFWYKVGRANFIMDNLIADGKATPAILVSCFGHTMIPTPPDDAPDGTHYNVPEINDDLIKFIIPLVDKEYKTKKDAKDRAILGFSMGGYHALTIGLNNPTVIGNIGGLSAGFRANQNLDDNFSGMLKNMDAVSKMKRVEIVVGSEEPLTSSQSVNAYLTGKGVKHEFITIPGGIHSWVTWREDFRDFMTKIFKD